MIKESLGRCHSQQKYKGNKPTRGSTLSTKMAVGGVHGCVIETSQMLGLTSTWYNWYVQPRFDTYLLFIFIVYL